MVGRQLVALKVTIHSPEEDYVSFPFLLTSQEGVIIVDTEMVSEEKEPLPKVSAEYSLWAVGLLGATAPTGVCLGKLWTQAITRLHVCLHHNFLLWPSTVLGKRGRRQVSSPYLGAHRIQGWANTPARCVNQCVCHSLPG